MIGEGMETLTTPGWRRASSALRTVVFTLALFRCVSLSHASWQNNLPPRRYVRLDPSSTSTFHGNHSDGDFFRILYRDETSIVVGARGVAYNISLADLRQLSKLDWESNASDSELCRLKGKPEVQCQNYIRVFVRSRDGSLFVCGTNAFMPRCRNYTVTEDGYSRDDRREKMGAGICPHSPVHNSTSTYVDGDLYAGTVADFSGQDALILRDNIRTDKWDTGALNDPNFVSSFHLGDHVYFFFRETAIEFINCGKRVYSRVARVCQRDVGGPNRFKHSWTSYMKTRLNCSVPGNFPFYFDEIQATTGVVDSSYSGSHSRLIYAVFTTEPNAIGGSAVCAFSLQSMLDAFSGSFKERASLNSNWLPVPSSKVPDPRPGQCANNSKSLPDMTLNFIKRHPLMDESVGSMFDTPLLTRVSTSYRFSAITVDPRVRTAGVGESDAQRYVDVLFIGTDNGRIIKAFNSHHEKSQPVVIEEIQVFPTNDAVKGLHISRMGEPKLVAASDSQLVMLPLHRCYTEKISVCGECVALQDPYCAWDLRRRRCMYIGNQRYTGPDYVQNVHTATSHRCPEGVGKSDRSGKGLKSDSYFGTGSVDQSDQILSFQSESSPPAGDRQQNVNAHVVPGSNHGPSRTEPVGEAVYSGETLAIAVLTTALAALLVGFLAGHCCARRCRKEDVNLPYADTDYTYFDQRHNANTRLAHEQNLLSEEVTYSEPVLIPTNNMVSTLKKNQPSMPLQHADKYDAGGLSIRPDKSATHRPLRSRPLREDAAEEMYRRESSLRRDVGVAPPTDGYATTRSVRRVYL